MPFILGLGTLLCKECTFLACCRHFLKGVLSIQIKWIYNQSKQNKNQSCNLFSTPYHHNSYYILPFAPEIPEQEFNALKSITRHLGNLNCRKLMKAGLKPAPSEYRTCLAEHVVQQIKIADLFCSGQHCFHMT